MHNEKWSKKEKTIARAAFDKAYKKECAQITEQIKKKALNISKPADIWQLNDYLYKQEKIDRKYDYRYSVLIWVFAALVKQQWLDINDFEGLSPDKIERIKTIGNMGI